MVPLTRRRLLHGTVGLAAGLAGCNSINNQSGSTPTASPTADRDDSYPDAHSTADPETVRARVTDGKLPVWLADSNQSDGRPTLSDQSSHRSYILIDDQARADRINIADIPAAKQVRSFLANTAFDRETVYIQTVRVKACFRLNLCHILWQPTMIETDYARTLLPYDEQCATGSWAIEAWLIRIPATLSEEDVNSYNSSIGSAACERTAGRGKATGEHGSTDTTDAVINSTDQKKVKLDGVE